VSVPALPLAVPAELIFLETPAGRIACYHAEPEPEHAAGDLPLLLVHSVNAAPSVAEVAPLFAHYRKIRHVLALDLPG